MYLLYMSDVQRLGIGSKQGAAYWFWGIHVERQIKGAVDATGVFRTMEEGLAERGAQGARGCIPCRDVWPPLPPTVIWDWAAASPLAATADAFTGIWAPSPGPKLSWSQDSHL